MILAFSDIASEKTRHTAVGVSRGKLHKSWKKMNKKVPRGDNRFQSSWMNCGFSCTCMVHKCF